MAPKRLYFGLILVLAMACLVFGYRFYYQSVANSHSRSAPPSALAAAEIFNQAII